jgi:hypothetical protein
MSTFSKQVSQSSDDAQQNSTGTNTTTLSSSTFAPSTAPYIGWRFQNVTIPQGATISACTLTLFVSTTKGAAAGTGTIDCQLATSAATFNTTANNLSGLALTGDGATWSFPKVTSTGNVTTVDFSAALQAAVAQGGWASGDPLVVVLYNPSTGCDIAFEMYDGNNAEAATINVTYSVTSSPAVPAPLFPPGAMGLGVVPGITNLQRGNRVEGTRYSYN